MNKQNKNRKIFSSKKDETLHKNLNFVAREQYKMLRTNILFTLPDEEKCHIIGVTSAIQGEGKSTTAINLAYVIAEKGSRVLLIDGDLRIPSIAKKMDIKGKKGLTDLLLNTEFSMDEFKTSISDNWYILPSGKLPPNPAELLSSSKMEKLLNLLAESFDYIILDLPPVNVVSDAISASEYLDGMILVVRQGYASKKDYERCIDQLKFAKINVLGYIMNNNSKNADFYGKRKRKKGDYYSSYEKKSIQASAEE